ncbi:4Fe-4S binding protein [Desulfovibrio desulfuricans]|uniref:4Fe-4S binding protein n=1 Tax=Desulfovibrio desulfuricans TaxID=876 RepID=UPI00398427CB
MTPRLHTVVFSPTGSSRSMAQETARVLEQELTQNMPLARGDDWDWTFPEGRAAAHTLGAEDVLVFAFPVYAGRIPPLLMEPLARLAGHGARAVPLAVYGNRHYDDALLEAVDLFVANGFSVPAAGAFVAEHSMTAKVGAGRPDAEDMAAIADFARRAASVIPCGKSATVAVPGNRPYKALPPAADIRPQTLDSCTQCGLCARVCPVRVIDADNAAQVAQGCLRCCACVKICPEQAKYFDNPQVDKIVAMLESNCRERREPEVFFAAEGKM